MGGRLVDAIEKQPAQVKIGPVNLRYNGAYIRKKSAFSLNVKSDDLPG